MGALIRTGRPLWRLAEPPACTDLANLRERIAKYPLSKPAGGSPGHSPAVAAVAGADTAQATLLAAVCYAPAATLRTAARASENISERVDCMVFYSGRGTRDP